MSNTPKQALFAEFAVIARAFGHPHRLEILEHLAQGERGVDALSECAGLSVANASQHLQLLKRAGLLASRRAGKNIFYRLNDRAALDVMASLRAIGERNLAQVDRIVRGYFAERDAMEPVSRADLLERTRAGLVTVIDVRPAEEFALGHVSGAVNVPLNALEAHMATLDPGKEIVAYCRSAYCVLSFEAVAILRSSGFSARRLEEGFPEWQAAGLETAA